MAAPQSRDTQEVLFALPTDLRLQGWSVPVGLAGLGYGLAVSRFLYETDPLSLRFFGGWIGVGLAGMLGAGLAVLLAVLARQVEHVRGWMLTAASIPGLLAWLYIFTPPLYADPLRGQILVAAGLLLSLLVGITHYIVALPIEGTGEPAGGWEEWLAVGVLALAVYLATLQRTIGRADTFEFQVTAPVLGIAHPTGYPLYLLFGKLFSLLPLGAVATRVNLTSAVAAVVATVLLAFTLRHIIRLDGLISAIAALAFAFSATLWSQAVIAEVYALHNAFVAAIVLCCLWLVYRSDYHNRHITPRVVMLLFLLVGLSLTNHLTTLLLLPAIALALLLAWPQITGRDWLAALGLLAGALLIYLYIPIRWPALHDGSPMPFADFLAWITGSQWRGALQLGAWLADPQRWQIVGRVFLSQYGWAGVALAILGLVGLARQRWQAAVFSGLIFLAYTFYGLNYLVPDIAVFLIPVALIGALWMGVGVSEAAHYLGEWGNPLLKERWKATHPAMIHAVVVTAFALIPASALWTVGPELSWKAEEQLEAWGRYVLSLPLAENSAILADSEKIAPLEYLSRIERIRPDIAMVVLGTEDLYRADLQQRLAAGQTVYLARLIPGLEGQYHLRSVGPLIEVGTAPVTEAPDDLDGQRVTWENGITLLGYKASSPVAAIGGSIQLTLYWQAPEQPPIQNYHVYLNLLDPGGFTAWEARPAFPVGGRYPQNAWKPGEIITDYYTIPMPRETESGQHILGLALVQPFSPNVLPIEGGGQWVDIGEYLALPRNEGLGIAGRRMAVAYPAGSMTGIDVPEVAVRGSLLDVRSSWRAGGTDFWSLQTVPAGNTQVLTASAPPAYSVYLAGEEDTAGDVIRWFVRGAPMRCGWLHPSADQCLLPVTTRLLGETVAEQIANFENRLLLTRAEFNEGTIRPGDQVEVTLEWQSLRALEEDYTVFIHLVGPDGVLHGQVDSWPVQGTYPTSAWEPGERVLDIYQVRLDDDAPPGDYRVEIGLYLLSTNTRLPIIDDSGFPVGDHLAGGGLNVSGQE